MRRFQQPIVLIGLPGAGKSTVGFALARRLNRPFYDIDHSAQSSDDHRFVEAESDPATAEGEWLERISWTSEPSVITAPWSQARSVVERGTSDRLVVFLDAGAETLSRRLSDDGVEDGVVDELQAALSRDADLLHQLAATATVAVTTDGRPVDDIVDEIVPSVVPSDPDTERR